MSLLKRREILYFIAKTKDPSKTSNCRSATHRSQVKHPKSFQIEEIIFWNCYCYTWEAAASRRRTSRGNISKEGEDAARFSLLVEEVLVEEGGGDPEVVLFPPRLEQPLVEALMPQWIGSWIAWVMLTRNCLRRLVWFNRLHRHTLSVLYTFSSGEQHLLEGLVEFRNSPHGTIAAKQLSTSLESVLLAGPQVLNRTIVIIPKYTPLLFMLPIMKQK